MAIGAAALAALAAAPASAAHSIIYLGTADFRSYSSVGGLPPGAVTGVHPYSAVFRYDDAGVMTSAGFSVDGIAREFFVCPLFLFCPDLSADATHVGSGAATTPEDGVQIGVVSPSAFGGLPLFGPGHRVYDLVSGDEGVAFLSFAQFDQPGFGYAYSEGDGTVSRIVTGVPEASSWAMMIAGFGVLGLVLRRRHAMRPA